MKTKGLAPGIIAREMALDIADAGYRPSIAEHVPGDHNVIPDMLSRKFQPGALYIRYLPYYRKYPRRVCPYAAESSTAL